jgi:hypothetical protein
MNRTSKSYDVTFSCLILPEGGDAVLLERQMRGKPEKSLFPSGDNHRREVEKRSEFRLAAAQDPDAALLLDDEQAAAVFTV